MSTTGEVPDASPSDVAPSDAAPQPATDFTELLAAAKEALAHSYVPYSHYPVGAAARTGDGRLVTGANIENASYGLTLCAECSLVSALHMSGGGRLVEFVCVNGAGEVIMPCGRCRQLLFEHGGRALRMLTVSGERTMAQVLPDAFGPSDLDDFAPPAPPPAPAPGPAPAFAPSSPAPSSPASPTP